MVPTPLIGTEHSLLLYSGEPEVLARHRVALEALGRPDLLGADPGRAALFDLGMLDVFFASMTSFLHAAAMLRADGVTAAEFASYADQVAAILPATFQSLAADVDTGTHPGTEDNLVMNAAALAHIVATAHRRGIDPAVAGIAHDLARRAIDRGHGADGFSRIVGELPTGATGATTADGREHVSRLG